MVTHAGTGRGAVGLLSQLLRGGVRAPHRVHTAPGPVAQPAVAMQIRGGSEALASHRDVGDKAGLGTHTGPWAMRASRKFMSLMKPSRSG